MQLWQAIDGAAKMQSGAFLIYQESSLVIRAIRDYFHPDIGELLIDTESIFEQAQQFMSHVMPATVNRVKLYKDDVPLFSRFQIEHQIETAYARQVPLPAGGAIVIDHTEALVSIDVNSARATKAGDIETTAFHTNLEAAEEIARQLRLRDLGGLIVIDFIDMESAKNQRDVENRLKDALKYDRARVQLGKISRFGLMELSRQRLRPALAESAYIPCPRCHGIGHIRGTESTALHILRILQEEAMKDNTAQVVAQVPVDVATFLLNEKRPEIHGIETRFKVNVLLVPNTYLETPNYKVQRLRHDDLNQSEPLPASFDLVERPEEEDFVKQKKEEAREPRQEAAVKGITPAQPAPMPIERLPVTETPRHENWLTTVMGWFKRQPSEVVVPVPAAPRSQPPREPREDGGRGRRERRDGRGEDRRNGKRDATQAQREQRAPQGSPQQPRREHEARDGAREPQKQRPSREPRPPREPRPADPSLAAITQGLPGATPAAEHGDGSRRRRDRRRGGRDRGERNGQGEQRGDRGGQRPVAAQAAKPRNEAPPAAHAEPEAFPVAAPTPSARPFEAPALAPPASAFESASAVDSARAQAQAAPVMAEQLPIAEASQPHSAPQLPRIALELPPDSGLVLVETTHAAPPATDDVEPPRPRRVRPPRPAVVDEPLQMVETAHKDPTPPAAE